MHAETRVVQIDVVVTNSQGRPVKDLEKEDFSITDRGRPRAIDIFSVNSGEPSTTPRGPLLKPLPPNVFSNRNAGPPQPQGHMTVILLDQLNVSHDWMRTPFQTAADEQLQVTTLMNKIPADEKIALYVNAKKLGMIVLQDYTTDRSLLVTRLKSYIPRGMGTQQGPSASAAKVNDGSPRRDPNGVPTRETDFFTG